MGKINGCLKCLFIFFNVLFLIVGCVLIFVAVKATAISIQMSAFGGPGVGWIWVITLGVFGISALGIFAACSEKELFLKIFAGFMGIGMIIMLIFGTVVAVLRNSLKQNYESKSKEFAEPLMKDEQSRQVLETIQMAFKCCGVVSAKDWGTEMPASCECTDTSGPFRTATCKPKPAGSSGPALIYAEVLIQIINNILLMLAVTAALSRRRSRPLGQAVTAALCRRRSRPLGQAVTAALSRRRSRPLGTVLRCLWSLRRGSIPLGCCSSLCPMVVSSLLSSP
ncbi:CD63 antigen-like [Poecilia reticulata]|uniref:CD63 antigen-like n=1 Tax=Poecilia reticulata TaxID=8081 RepID=UPI0004A3004E|nr:PREDICTED: CD63 antigen-like [Poecilia reticulata]